MDGYALRAADSDGATPDARRLPVTGEIAAGSAVPQPLPPGAAVRIMTGAPMPPDADAVLPVEQTRALGGAVELLGAVQPGDYVRQTGEDVLEGQQVLDAGAVLRPGELGLLASLGYALVPVYRRPRVAILATGDELVPIEQRPGPGQIRNSNATMLAAQVLRCGAVPHLLPVARDTRDSVHAALDAGRGCDLYLSSGGVSVGDYDVVKAVLAERGEVRGWRINMKPGKPVAFGSIDDVPFLGLPGNPVSSFVTFEFFARPLLRKMAGHRMLWRQAVAVRMEDALTGNQSRRHYARALVRWQDDGWHATTTGAQDSHRLRSTVTANALVIVPEGAEAIPPGGHAMALLLDWPEAQ